MPRTGYESPISDHSLRNIQAITNFHHLSRKHRQRRELGISEDGVGDSTFSDYIALLAFLELQAALHEANKTVSHD